MDLLLDPFGVDHHACVMPYHHPLHLHLTGGFVNPHIGHPSGPSGTKARPLAVDVSGIGHALPDQPITLRWALLRLGVRLPTGFVSGRLHHGLGAFIGQMRQAVLQGVRASGSGQFVDETLMRK